MKKFFLSISIGFSVILTGCSLGLDSLNKEDITHSIKEESKPVKPQASEWKQIQDQQAKAELEQFGVAFVSGNYMLKQEYFNDVIEVDGVPTIQNADNILVLTNKTYALPADYEPDNLVQPNVTFVYKGAEQNYMRKEAAGALEDLFEAAQLEGINLFARSGYRSYDTQQMVYNQKVNQEGREYADVFVAKPGMSEHQTGLTMDITANSVNQKLVQSFGDTKEGIWLEENAHKYGYILRYPKDKEDITHYNYEPWHFRYVGKKAAAVIYENNWTLEEFFEVVNEV